MPFTSLAFQTQLILLKLRNQKRIDADRHADEDDGRKNDAKPETDGGKLANKRRSDS